MAGSRLSVTPYQRPSSPQATAKYRTPGISGLCTRLPALPFRCILLSALAVVRTPSYRILLPVRLTASFASPFLYPVPCHASHCMRQVTPTHALLSVPSICISAVLLSALKKGLGCFAAVQFSQVWPRLGQAILIVEAMVRLVSTGTDSNPGIPLISRPPIEL